jgi:hypothetical protein
MKDNTPAKKGKDFGLDPNATGYGSPVPENPNQEYNYPPSDRDHAVWEDPCNFDPNIAHRKPMDGLDATVWGLFHGKVNKI